MNEMNVMNFGRKSVKKYQEYMLRKYDEVVSYEQANLDLDSLTDLYISLSKAEFKSQ